MALIKCPECGKEISSQSSVCIHCGYPINDSKIKNVILVQKFKDWDKYILEKQNLSLAEATELRDKLTKENEQKKKNALDNNDQWTYNLCSKRTYIIEDVDGEISKKCGKEKIERSLPRCPKCGSTAITTGARGWKWTTGFLGSGKTVNRCGNCGYVFEPKGR